MTTAYVDTSAAAKLLIEEAESASLASHLDTEVPDLVACLLLETELRRVAVRAGIPQSEVTTVLDGVSLYDMPRSLYQEAGLLAGGQLRSLDALHLGAAIRIGVDVVLTYDQRLSAAAQSLGLAVLAPS